MGPADLSELLTPLLAGAPPNEAVLVGPATADDAGVYRLGDVGVVATADFITPVCDDPRRFGRVAAANALSDVYAMGGSVLFALNLCCFPEGDVPAGTFSEVLEGGLEKLTEAGGALLGGHSVRDPELKFGLVVVGRVDPDRMLTNAGARPGQQLVLTKPLGTGAIINGYRAEHLDDAGIEPAMLEMERLNELASRLLQQHGATACTDVTGYGLAGHALEMARASEVAMRIQIRELPVHEAFEKMSRLGVAPRGTHENAAAYANELTGASELDEGDRQLLFDPQTSGGLLASLPAEAVEELLSALEASGHRAARIGEVIAPPARLEIA